MSPCLFLIYAAAIAYAHRLPADGLAISLSFH